jgi:hypothetical protein
MRMRRLRVVRVSIAAIIMTLKVLAIDFWIHEDNAGSFWTVMAKEKV